MKRIGRGNVCKGAIRVCIDNGIMQECITDGFAKAWGMKMEIVRIDDASKPWEATGGARTLAPEISRAWLVL